MLHELVRKVQDADIAYYNTGTSTMSDYDYDQLKNQIREIDPNHPILKTVGAPVSEHLSKARHKIPMGSLSNCSRDGDKANPSFAKWHYGVARTGEEPIILMHKLDGSSVEFVYENGVLVQAITRGDGQYGEDITKNARKFKGVQVRLSEPFSGSVRGEALLLLSDFREHFAEQANPRNAANGTVRRSDGSGAEHISFIAFDLVSDKEFHTQCEKLGYLNQLGLDVVAHSVYEHINDVLDAQAEAVRRRPGLIYEIDGLVAMVNDLNHFKSLGVRDNRPKGAVAFKFQATEATTVLKGVKISLGHTGAVIPTADLASVNIGGVNVTSALLNNYEEIERLGVQIGDEVKVIRAGDVIPKIIGVAREGDYRTPIVPPTKCPGCEEDLVKDGAHIKCKNQNCEGKNFRLLKSWVDKRNILHIGDNLLETLFDEHNIRTPASLYTLTEEYLAAIPRGNGVVGSNAKRIMEEINKSRDCPLNEFIGSLGIEFLGRRQAEMMIDQGINTLEKFVTVTIDQLVGLDGFSERKATAVVNGIKRVIGQSRITDLLDVGVNILDPDVSEPVESVDGVLSGKTFVFTGKIDKIDASGKRFTRNMMHDVVLSNGGQVDDKINSGVTYLVQADPTKESSKTKKAKKSGVEIISEASFWEMVDVKIE